ncbi:DUF7527 domain-containing protein [Natranaeroarchaeum sulfidigenes]|uniref:DUF7527 domain-containing protein n=1 Tax=Natranaeroarchaeum sulfidigenes TaxID=2784880 RepID=A0A897MPJ6_9EURY|nr:hypothetical protein [Natranaeroarchaeum sulfidigenes]QSG01888.1 Uncharacterized protein AArcS_0661 [Natranaeroarchaeum sulfidigenes]
MNTRTLERVERWESRPYSGGYEGLRDLAGTEFTGAVETAGTWLFMLNGRIIGVHDGSIEAFEDGSGTAYVAPEPALPLLFTMWEGETETRAKYYTEDTPVSEVDNTLTSGSFTGYLELSENVLSGDYFVVYYGGRSMSAAFVGTREELLGGDEAFERANDEVGIYEVVDADVDVIEIPEAEPEPERAESTDPSTEDGGTSPETSDSVRGPPAVDSTPATDEPAETTGANENTSDAVSATAPDSSRDGRASAQQEADVGQTDGETVGNATPTTNTAPDGVEDTADVSTTRKSDTHGQSPEEERSSTSTGERNGTDDASIETGNSPTTEQSDDRPVNGRTTADAPPKESTEVTAQPADTGSRIGENVDDTSVSGEMSADEGTTSATVPSETTTSDAVPDEPTTSDDDTGSVTTSERTESDTPSGSNAPPGADDAQDDPIEAEADWRETTVIPSIDPTHTEHPGPDTEDATGKAAESPATTRSSPGQAGQQRSLSETGRQARSTPDRRENPTTEQRSSDGDERASRTTVSEDRHSNAATVPKARVAEREERIDELEAKIDQLEATREELRTERDELAAENESLADTVEQLEHEVERLRSERDELEATLEAAGKTAYDSSQQIQPSQAISGTNLFVRYGSKGEATLEAAHDGAATAEDVNANLQLERHTTFDAESVAVQGEPYDAFLDGTLEMQFVDWIVETLLYEIQDTGNQSGLRDLYDVIPDIDRVEFDGEIELAYTENGEEVTEVAAFDVVLRNRMGEPLIVADISDSRDPAGERMLVELESDASRVKESSETLSAAFLVTSSFFEPGALEAASEATSGSFLSRDSRMSFVKQSRKQGYHLCLVEARGDEFHLNVPEL